MTHENFTPENQELLDFVNDRSPRLFGIKRIDDQIHGLILPEDKELYWIPLWQLTKKAETAINEWLLNGWKIE